MMKRRRVIRAETGICAVLVIWIAGVLAVVATSFAVSVRLHVKGEANLAGVPRRKRKPTASSVFSPTGCHLPVRGAERERWRSTGRRSLVRRAAAGGLWWPSRTRAGSSTSIARPVAALALIIDRAGGGGGRGEEIARAIADFRDADSIAMAGGAEESLVTDGPGMKNCTLPERR